MAAAASKCLLLTASTAATQSALPSARHWLARCYPHSSLLALASSVTAAGTVGSFRPRQKYYATVPAPTAASESTTSSSTPPAAAAGASAATVTPSAQSSSSAQTEGRPLTAKEASDRLRREIEASGQVIGRKTLKQYLAKARVQWRKENPDLVKERTLARKARQAEAKEQQRANSEKGLTPEEIAAKRSREKLEQVQIAADKKRKKKEMEQAKLAKKLELKMKRKQIYEEGLLRGYERKAAHALAVHRKKHGDENDIEVSLPPPPVVRNPNALLGPTPSGSFEYLVDWPGGPSRMKVTYTQNTDEIRKWLITHANHPYIGLDTERKPTFKKGALREKTALMQLSTPDGHVLLLNHLQLSKVDRGKYQPELENLLRDPKVLKAGVGIWEDFNYLIKDWRLDIDNELSGKCGVVDIMSLAMDDPRFLPPPDDVETPEHPWVVGRDGVKRPPVMKFGLKALTERYLGFELAKSKSVQTANWSCHFPMKRAMSEYAAKDAWVGARIFAVLTEKMSEEEIAALPANYHAAKKPPRPATPANEARKDDQKRADSGVDRPQN
ncbi:hypothetical protein HDU89_003599 [Geranomyces variabilis]|nr:hypothetical protein HDU89_003599 [Geranomyces variabilis]